MATESLAAQWAKRVETKLDRALPAADIEPRRLHQAMRHAVLGGGKRLRAQLVYAAGRACGALRTDLDAAAVAVELVHAFSLVHDDLPAMDDDDLRRGKPTVHVAFDEATAILAGDALQALAFKVLADAYLPPDIRIALVAVLADATGSRGMCGGQQMDMDATGRGRDGLPPLRNWKGQDMAIDPEMVAQIHLQQLHDMKTGALIRASVAMGARIGTEDEDLLDLLDVFAGDLGMAFQIRDDILDVESDGEQLGKTAGKDAAQDKLTYPAVYGMAGAKEKLLELQHGMKFLLKPLGARASGLRMLADFAITRAY